MPRIFMDKNINEMTEQERCMLRAYGIIRERANIARLERDFVKATAYESAAEMIRYGINCNWECLNQFDY